MDNAAQAYSNTTVTTESLEASRQWCAHITRTQAKNFYWGLRLAPADRRPDLYALYSWMRVADDIADGDSGPTTTTNATSLSTEQRGLSLAQFRRATHALLDATNDRVCAHELGSLSKETSNMIVCNARLWPAFVHAATAHKISRNWLDEALDGMAEDLNHRGYADFGDLEQYCYRVASTVGLLCVSIWGLRRGVDVAHAQSLAIARGKAFQLTNILRDIAVDARTHTPPRCYVPTNMLCAHGLTHEGLLAWTLATNCQGLVLELVARARLHQRESALLESMIDPACVPVLRAMSGLYWRILDRIEAKPWLAVATPPVRVPTVEKVGVMLRSLALGSRAKS